MNNQEVDVLLENQSLKFEFAIRNLDIEPVFWATPDDLERENRALRHLLDWVQRYTECGDRKRVETEGYDFPPIHPDISPENDWYRFERWMQGKPIRQTLKDRLPPQYILKSPEQLTDEEIIAEFKLLAHHLAELHVAIEFQEEIPPRLAYAHLLECLEDEFDLIEEGFWYLDGCTGYCPGCYQRPWCETGGRSCWPEDEQAGKMCLIDLVKDYVSASPVSLAILQKCQAEEDKELEEFEKNQPDGDLPIAPFPFDLDDEDQIPF